MKNIVLLFNENLLQLENIRANYNYISLTILTNNKIKKKVRKNLNFLNIPLKKKLVINEQHNMNFYEIYYIMI